MRAVPYTPPSRSYKENMKWEDFNTIKLTANAGTNLPPKTLVSATEDGCADFVVRYDNGDIGACAQKFINQSRR